MYTLWQLGLLNCPLEGGRAQLLLEALDLDRTTVWSAMQHHLLGQVDRHPASARLQRASHKVTLVTSSIDIIAVSSSDVAGQGAFYNSVASRLA